MSDDLGLEGKVAVITGSSRGWGLGQAKQLARRGVKVVMNGVNQQRLEESRAEVDALGPGAVGVAADISTREGCEQIIAGALEAFGQIDILVNNAGRVAPGTLLEMSVEAWDRVLAVQLTAQFHTSQIAARHMVERGRGGRIINMVGGAGFSGFYANANHAASKAGGMGAVLTWAQELAQYDITVNGLAGAIDTDQSRPFLEQARENRRRDGLDGALPARAFGYYPPEEAASIVVWLASDRAAGVTGRYFCPHGPELQVWQMPRVEKSIFHVDTWTPEFLEQIHLADLVGADMGIDPSLTGDVVVALLEDADKPASTWKSH